VSRDVRVSGRFTFAAKILHALPDIAVLIWSAIATRSLAVAVVFVVQLPIRERIAGR
jgi:hypothetical protein